MGVNNSDYQITVNRWDNNKCREADIITQCVSSQIKTPTQEFKPQRM